MITSKQFFSFSRIVFSTLILFTGFTGRVQAQVYCSTLYTSGCAAGDNIQNVSVSTLNQIATGCTGGTGYADYTGIVVPMSAGTVYPYTVTTDYPSSEYLGWWIDLNNNGSFGDAGEFIGGSGPFGYTTTGNISLPCGAAAGNHRMRLRLVYATAQSLTTSCTTYTYGETHDYTVNVSGGGPVGDLLATAINIPALPYSTTNNNLFANCWTHNTGQPSADVYYKLIPDCSGTLTVSMCGGGTLTDSYLHLQNAAGTDIAFNDDNGPSCVGLLSSLNYAVTAGTIYYIVCEGYSTNEGTFSLDVSLAGAGITYYADDDGDGYGDPATTITACSPPAGYVLSGTDCNDAKAAIQPGATEI